MVSKTRLGVMFGSLLALASPSAGDYYMRETSYGIHQKIPQLTRFYEVEKELKDPLRQLDAESALEKYRSDANFSERYNALRNEYNDLTKQEELVNAKNTIEQNEDYARQLWLLFGAGVIGIAVLALDSIKRFDMWMQQRRNSVFRK